MNVLSLRVTKSRIRRHALIFGLLLLAAINTILLLANIRHVMLRSVPLTLEARTGDSRRTLVLQMLKNLSRPRPKLNRLPAPFEGEVAKIVGPFHAVS